MIVPAQTQSTTDDFGSRYAELIESSYDCIDRIVINAYNPLLQQAGGFRFWWRQWKGSDEGLETTQLMRIAGCQFAPTTAPRICSNAAPLLLRSAPSQDR